MNRKERVDAVGARGESAPRDQRAVVPVRREVSLQAFVALGALLAAMVMNGCASRTEHAEADRWRYNPTTGYPAVGAGE